MQQDPNSKKSEMVEDVVDCILAAQDGKMPRQSGRLCVHGPHQKCTNCLPLDPYDEGYLNERGVKHMSFHAYVRKLTDLHGAGTQLKKPLENVNCKLKLNCAAGHKPYPASICAKCRPSVLTLMRQVYRHVDNIQIENVQVVGRFLDFWRRSGLQRMGYLIGRYEPYTEVPLGIRARVCAVYEPPQQASDRHVKFGLGLSLGGHDGGGGEEDGDGDPNGAAVDRLLGWLGMHRVGWLFTDLWPADPRAGTVHCIRNEDSFLLSAQECITAGWLQSRYKNATRFCSDAAGVFGSKFVTVVASGDSNQQVHLSGYQVSNQCTAMVEADILCPTRGHPELAWVRERPLNEHHYITHVQYSEKNEYGLEVMRQGRPMPGEYLLVDVPTGTPVHHQPLATFSVPREGTLPFPLENRSAAGETQDHASVAAYFAQFPGTADDFLRLASDFHFLLFLAVNDWGVHFEDAELAQLCTAVVAGDAAGAWLWAQTSANWARVGELMADSGGTSAAGPSSGGSRSSNFAP